MITLFNSIILFRGVCVFSLFCLKIFEIFVAATKTAMDRPNMKQTKKEQQIKTRNEWAMPTRKFQNSHYFMDGHLPTTDSVCVCIMAAAGDVRISLYAWSSGHACVCVYVLRSSEGEWQVNARNKIKYKLKCVNSSRRE